MNDKLISRRELLRGAAAAAAFTIVPRHVLGGTGYKAPSEKLTRAIIGTGGMGMGHVNMEGAVLLAVCDVDRNHVTRARDRARERGEDPRMYRDFREVLARDDIDVVHIVTPPHWHAIMSIWAAQAGKDVWCEKPMTRTIGEGIKVVETINKTGRMFRVNTSSRFGGNWYDSGMSAPNIKRLVQAGLFGWPVKMYIGKATGFDWKLDQWSGQPNLPQVAVPPELDYDMWLGPAPVKPYHPDRVHMKFRGFWDYDGGGLGDMGQHYLDPVQYILGKDYESAVSAVVDAPQQHPDAVGHWRTVRLRYADGCELILDGTDDNRENVPLIEGPGGKLYKSYRTDKGDQTQLLNELPHLEPMQSDFYESVRTRVKFGLNEQVAHNSCNLINLAKVALRTGREVIFDPVKQVFIDDPEANAFMYEPMRGPWHLS